MSDEITNEEKARVEVIPRKWLLCSVCRAVFTSSATGHEYGCHARKCGEPLIPVSEVLE
jgi:hypothetical protein